MAKVVTSEVVANGMLFDGRQFTVTKLDHDRDIVGVGSTAYAVNVYGNNQYPDQSYGFRTVDDAFRFVTTGGSLKFDGADQNGDHVEITRNGLGIPSAMVNDQRKNTERTNAETKEKTASGRVV